MRNEWIRGVSACFSGGESRAWQPARGWVDRCEQRAESCWNNWVRSSGVWKAPGQQKIAITQWDWRWDLWCVWSTTRITPYLSLSEELEAASSSQGAAKAPCKYLFAPPELRTDRLPEVDMFTSQMSSHVFGITEREHMWGDITVLYYYTIYYIRAAWAETINTNLCFPNFTNNVTGSEIELVLFSIKVMLLLMKTRQLQHITNFLMTKIRWSLWTCWKCLLYDKFF